MQSLQARYTNIMQMITTSVHEQHSHALRVDWVIEFFQSAGYARKRKNIFLRGAFYRWHARRAPVGLCVPSEEMFVPHDIIGLSRFFGEVGAATVKVDACLSRDSAYVSIWHGQ